MIQLSFTKKCHSPQAIWFDLLHDSRPDEYSQHFYGYQYLTEEEAEQMLDDPCVSQVVKNELSNALV